MKKSSPYLCNHCGELFPKWFGRCSSCQTYNSCKEFHEANISSSSKKTTTGINLTKIKSTKQNNQINQITKRIKTNISEIDHTLGGGFFPASLILFGGHPGIGKSTLALQIFLQISNSLYFSGEENYTQIQDRAIRLQPNTTTTDFTKRIFATYQLEDICQTILEIRPPFAIIDSIQMVGLTDQTLGAPTSIRENAEILLKTTKQSNTTIFVIGHVTKNDELAGPKALEHIVDCVLYLEGERNSELRILRSPKNRFGSTLEIGVFTMHKDGLQPVVSPSQIFLAERSFDVCGSVITVIREGVRNFLLEIQVLLISTNFGQPRRTAHGIDLAKFHLLLAVISKFTPFKCENFDAYLNVVGGLKIHDTAMDLAICATIISSRSEKALPSDTVILGEVGLTGEVRRVLYLESRLNEIIRLGFHKAIVPKIPKNIKRPANLELIEIQSIGDLVELYFNKY